MANLLGTTQGTIKYGYVYGPRMLVGPVQIGADEQFKDTGGKFCWYDTSRYLELAGSGNNPDSASYIAGWLEVGAMTASATDGGSMGMLDRSPYAVYRIPADAAVTIAMRSIACDLITTSYVQLADVGEQNENYLIIEDVDIANQCVYVRMNPAAIYIA